MNPNVNAPPNSRPKTMIAVRYGLPALILLAGIVALLVSDTLSGLEGLAMGIGVAGSVLLLNVLYRVGVKGDLERDDEEAARVYFDEHGRWPDEDAAARAPAVRSAAPLTSSCYPACWRGVQHEEPHGEQQPGDAPRGEHREVAAGQPGARRARIEGDEQRVDERLDRQEAGDRLPAPSGSSLTGTKTPEMKYSGSTTAFVIAGAASSPGISAV